jgi:hypothetical protein
MHEDDLAELRAALRGAMADLSVLEGKAAVMAHHLGASPILTLEEREFASERLCPDEAAHMRWARTVVRYLGGYDLGDLRERFRGELDELLSELETTQRTEEDRMLVARINHDERFFSRTMNKFRFVVTRLLPDELQEGAERIAVDEEAHKEWGTGILRRLRAEYPDWRPQIRRYQTIRKYPAESIAREFLRIQEALEADEHHTEAPSFADVIRP